ncbi:conserved exported protein of unknown function [Bradyrhizobium sp. ORS 285]|uniref:hypothetical protein n=1 Tax=Bradyrhizobium sp. ORS 285 TaxID=115808 RepID=UPI00024083E8|nr:hypothetical protein [Bradyrhizobium sp. ORS 285]CCD85629.1 conserved exported hypothetical protein [Bradyrhizobium sp. ORS 285]SMX58943.1 conserved exported protein of unknown function [Bradyrhizobium sp. ORS 285]
MRAITITLALATAAALSATAQAASRLESRRVVQRPERLVIDVPAARDPFWIPDYNIVPRYRYRPEDDRVDTSPYAPPVARSEPRPGSLGIGQ